MNEDIIKLTKHNIKLETDVKSWIDLPHAYSNSFDIVFCIGNSRVNSPDAISRQNNLAALIRI